MKEGLPKSAYAFTLAELLIALAILGVIATFTIPKVLQAQQDAQRIAVFKETIAALNQAYYTEYQTKAHYDTLVGHYGDVAKMHLNYDKYCPNNAATQGCWTQGGISPTEQGQPGFILHNGATIAGFDNPANPCNGIIIDWNGPLAPNLQGDDQLHLYVCASGSDPRTVGQLRPYDTTNIPLYQSIFNQ